MESTVNANNVPTDVANVLTVILVKLVKETDYSLELLLVIAQ
jgi:hypothetical protein